MTENQKRKLILINNGEEQKILEYIDANQLETRYGGSLPNLKEYWPPKGTSEETTVYGRLD